jgi:hypothetical protein
VTWRHVTQESLRKSPGLTDYRALRATHARAFQASDVVNDGEALSEITFAENSLAQNDEKHRRAYGCACIALGKGWSRELKAEEKQATESGQKHNGGKRLRRQRP